MYTGLPYRYQGQVCYFIIEMTPHFLVAWVVCGSHSQSQGGIKALNLFSTIHIPQAYASVVILL